MTVPVAPAFPGPAALGRGAVVGAHGDVPDALDDAPRYVVDDAVLDDPGPLAQVLHHHWVRREPVVVELRADNDALRRRETTDLPPWELGPWFGFERERLSHRVWANSYDLRTGTPVWWRGELAARHTPVARAEPGADGDVVLPDGRTAWVDGGPRGPVPGVDQPLVHRESVELLRRADVDADGPLADDLADDQLAAASHAAGPARVLAPAGAGKTRVMTSRLRHLLGVRGVQPELVTAVAYNKRAAEELRGRVEAPDADGRVLDARVHVRTIHSLAYAICRDAGISRVLDERGVRSLLDDLVRFPKVQNADPAQAWLDALAEVRIGLRSPEVVAAEHDDVEDLPDVLPRYRAALAERGAVDFDEQVCRAIELLCADPSLRDAWRMRCTHLLVDEFQDLTPAYVLLLRLLGWPDLQVFGVGDDDQVIYGHAGADPGFLLDLDLLFPGPADHRLLVNHRCPTDVVGAAATLLTHNRRRVSKRIEARPDASDGLRITTAPRQDVATVVRDHVVDLVAGGVAPGDVAVLSRVNASLLPTQVLLALAGVPTSAPLSDIVLRRTGTSAALAYLRIACDPDQIHPGDLHLTAKRPSRGLTGVLREHVVGERRWSLDALSLVGDVLTDAQADRLDGYVADLRHLALARSRGADTADLLALVRTDVGLGEAMEGLDRAGRLDGSSHGDDLAALEQLAAHQPDPTRFHFWVRDALRVPGDPAGVHMSSVHRVKGEEWPHVVVAPLQEGLLPHRLAEDVEEERRVLHVAVTRGRESVLVVGVEQEPSMFLPQLAAADPAAEGSLTGELAAHATAPLPDAVTPERRHDGVVAAPGLRLVLPGGLDAVVDDVDAGGPDPAAIVRVLRDGAPLGVRVRVRLVGADAGPPTAVEVDGDRTHLLAPRAARPAATGAPTLTGTAAPDLSRHADPAVVEPMFQRLREWRTEQARTMGKPPYVVFNDATLRAIAERQPRGERELLSIKGVGPAKLDQHGDDVLAIVRDVVG